MFWPFDGVSFNHCFMPGDLQSCTTSRQSPAKLSPGFYLQELRRANLQVYFKLTYLPDVKKNQYVNRYLTQL